MVSRDEMLGLRDRSDVGVEGMEEVAEKEKEWVGNGSLNLEVSASPREGVEMEELAVLDAKLMDGLEGGGCESWYRGEAGRRRPLPLREKLTLWGGRRMGELCSSRSGPEARGFRSSSESSAMLSISVNVGMVACGYNSSRDLRGGRVAAGERRGLDDLAGEREGDMSPKLTVGKDLVRAMGGAERLLAAECDRRWVRE